MRESDQNLFSRAEEFLALFNRGAAFTRELLEENKRLRERLMRFADRQEMAAQNPEEWAKLRQELVERISTLEAEYTDVRERLDQVEEENDQFAQRYVEVEEENNNLANLYVASYQLHSTLDLDEVVKIIMEIVINLIGAEVFAVYLYDEESAHLRAVASEGEEVSAFPHVQLGEGPLGEAVMNGEAKCWENDFSGDLEKPVVCVPLVIHGKLIGAIAVYALLSQKDGFSPLDHELFNMLGGHAATALFAARLYSQSERKLSTIQGFIDLLAR
ncbi:MAG: GAF domain-containing protein [Myxococcota bacterium]